MYTQRFYTYDDALRCIFSEMLFEHDDVISRKLKRHQYSQCEVLSNSVGDMVFRSYTTDILFITRDGYVFCTGLYSKTTRRQLSWFLSEYYTGLDYHGVANMYYNNEIYNCLTNEFASKEIVAKRYGLYKKKEKYDRFYNDYDGSDYVCRDIER